MSTASCSNALNPLGFLRSGTNVAANTQIGKTNSQTIGTNETRVFAIEDVAEVKVSTLDQSSTKSKSNVDAGKVENLNIDNGPSNLEILILFLALFLDSPMRWPGQIWRGIKRFRAFLKKEKQTGGLNDSKLEEL